MWSTDHLTWKSCSNAPSSNTGTHRYELLPGFLLSASHLHHSKPCRLDFVRASCPSLRARPGPGPGLWHPDRSRPGLRLRLSSSRLRVRLKVLRCKLASVLSLCSGRLNVVPLACTTAFTQLCTCQTGTQHDSKHSLLVGSIPLCPQKQGLRRVFAAFLKTSAAPADRSGDQMIGAQRCVRAMVLVAPQQRTPCLLGLSCGSSSIMKLCLKVEN